EARLLIVGGGGRLWDPARGNWVGRKVPETRFPGAEEAYAPGGKMLTLKEGEVGGWDLATGERTAGWNWAAGRGARGSFSPDGRFALAVRARPGGSTEEQTRVWDWRTNRPLSPLLTLRGYKKTWAFAPDGRRLLTESSDEPGNKEVRLWDWVAPDPLRL